MTPGVIRTLLIALACGGLQLGCSNAPLRPVVNYLPASELASAGARLPRTGFLSTGQPDEAAIGTIAAAGYTGVIDLRTAAESRGFDEAGKVRSTGMRYASLPIAGPDDITYQNAAKLDALLGQFAGPVLLHCGSGNRVGALFALRAKAGGATEQEALAAGRAAGLTDLEDVVRQRLADADQVR